MRWVIIFVFLFPFVSLTNTSSPDNFQICFFELNNTTTSENLKKHTAFKKSLAPNTEIHIFKPTSSHNNSKGFKAMIEETSKAGKRCDSLVISGHHTGNWSGQFGSLKLKEVEDLSCDPKYKNWFKNIRSLWLDGCNTLTDNLVKSTKGIPTTPDSESARVSEKETKKDKEDYVSEKRIRNLNQAYTLSLDKNTPLSSRYLRAFPNTQIYGFNGAAPEGSETKNQIGNRSFIANHLSLIGKALREEKRFLEQKEESADIILGLTALFSDLCDEDRIESWEKVGQGYIKTEAIENQNYEMAGKLGCDLILAKQVLDNPDSKSARTALAQKIKEGGYSRELLNLANEILNSKNESQNAIKLAKKLVQQTLDKIAEEDKKLGAGNNELSLSHLLFNNIYETWVTAKKYKTKDSRFFNSVKIKLSSGTHKRSLKTRIQSPQTSSIRKADYIKFYIDVNDEKPNFIDKAIKDLVKKAEELFPKLRSPRENDLSERSRRALALSVADQLLQYELLTSEQKQKLLESKNLFPQNTKDSFNINVNVNLRIANGEEGKILDKIKNKTGSSTYREIALTAITEHYLQTGSIEKFTNMMNSVVINDQDNENRVWNKMHSSIQNKAPKERISLMVQLINKTDAEDETRAFVSDYAFHLPENEKKELCPKIKQKYKWYKNNTIKCPSQ